MSAAKGQRVHQSSKSVRKLMFRGSFRKNISGIDYGQDRETHT
jgi:hypothetical protein